jgi:gentisate 1,2-dioxygenase
MTEFAQWLQDARRMKEYDPESQCGEQLVTPSASATWLDPAMTGNPAQIGVLLDVPARTMEFYLQQLAPGVAGDLQRHRHESVHYVIEGEGHTEIGPRTVTWRTGDLVYTPPWVWHRHYNDGAITARMLLVENSRLLESLGLNQRESAGEVSYSQRPR